MDIPSSAAERSPAAVVIRRATPDDAERLSELCAEHARFERIDFVAAGHVARLEAALADASTLVVWLAETPDATLGYAAATPAYSTLDAMAYLHMDCLYLQADHRGRRIGTGLLDRVAAHGASLGLPRIEWQTPAWNRAAAKFYRRQGAAQRAKLRFVLTLALLATVATGARAQSSFHPDLAAGPYAVGFRALALEDRTRTMGRVPRPIEVSIWYPAVASPEARPMRLREYAWLTTLPGGHPLPHIAAEQLLLQMYAAADSARSRRELDAATTAIRDAPSAPGRFPIIVYGPGRDGVAYDNTTLLEYVASHGYLVLASPSWGAAGPMTGDFAGVETQARDMEFLLAYARTLPHADTAHAGVVGYSWGGLSNILVAMRNASVNAVVSLDGSIAYWYNRRFKHGPFVDPDRLGVPTLFLKQGDPFPSMSASDRAVYGADTTFTFFDELRYADAYLVTLNRIRHQNFSSLHDRLPPSVNGTPAFVDSAVVSTSYGQIAQYTLAFLDACLKGSHDGADRLARAPDASVTIERRTALRPRPTVADFARASMPRGLAAAPDVLTEIRRSDPGYLLPEDEVDLWARALSEDGRDADALGIFELNATMYPRSASAAQSLAEARRALAHLKGGT